MIISLSRFWNWETQRVLSKWWIESCSRQGTSKVRRGKLRDPEEVAPATSLAVTRITIFLTRASAAFKTTRAVTPNWQIRVKDASPLLLALLEEAPLNRDLAKRWMLPPKLTSYRKSASSTWATSNCHQRKSYLNNSQIRTPRRRSTTSTESVNRPSRSKTTFSCWKRFISRPQRSVLTNTNSMKGILSVSRNRFRPATRGNGWCKLREILLLTRVLRTSSEIRLFSNGNRSEPLNNLGEPAVLRCASSRKPPRGLARSRATAEDHLWGSRGRVPTRRIAFSTISSWWDRSSARKSCSRWSRM